MSIDHQATMEANHLVALIEDHLRAAVSLAEGSYGPAMRFESSRWVLLALAGVLDLPEALLDPALDQAESYLATVALIIASFGG